MNLEDLEVKIFKALGHPLRLRIVKKLIGQNLCVCELNEDVEFSQSNLSQHLKILRDAGILVSEKKGLNIHYAIKNEKIIDMFLIAENIVKSELLEMLDKIK